MDNKIEYSTKFFEGQKVRVIDGFYRFKKGKVLLNNHWDNRYLINFSWYFLTGVEWIEEKYLEAI